MSNSISMTHHDPIALLPCPFCGSNNVSCESLGKYHDDEQNEREDFITGCNECNACFPPECSQEESIFYWITRPAQAALSEEDAVPIIALTLYERDPATSNGLALSWRQCEDIFPERINQVLGDAEAAYRALTSQNRR